VALGLLVARAAAPTVRPSFARLWAVGTAGVAAACGGQAIVASAVGGGTALGGGWLGLLALCVLAGAVLAVALRAAPSVARSLRPAAPRPKVTARLLWRAPVAAPTVNGGSAMLRPLGRAPPAFI
jgi:hypothetical protein